MRVLKNSARFWVWVSREISRSAKSAVDARLVSGSF